MSNALRSFYRSEEDALIAAVSSGSGGAKTPVELKHEVTLREDGVSFTIKRLGMPKTFRGGEDFGFIEVSGGLFTAPVTLVGVPVSHMTTEGAWESAIKGNMKDASSGSGGFSPHGGSMKCSYFCAGDGNYGEP